MNWQLHHVFVFASAGAPVINFASQTEVSRAFPALGITLIGTRP
jgi:hypothetical protein